MNLKVTITAKDDSAKEEDVPLFIETLKENIQGIKDNQESSSNLINTVYSKVSEDKEIPNLEDIFQGLHPSIGHQIELELQKNQAKVKNALSNFLGRLVAVKIKKGNTKKDVVNSEFIEEVAHAVYNTLKEETYNASEVKELRALLETYLTEKNLCFRDDNGKMVNSPILDLW